MIAWPRCTMNALEKSTPRHLSVAVLFAIATVCILQPCFCLADSKNNHWPVRYLAGSKKSQAGAKLDLAIVDQEVTGKKGKNIVLHIPAASITVVGYDTSSHSRSWAWLDAGSTADQGKQEGSLAGPPLWVPFAVGAIAVAPFKSTQHFVRILWQEDGVPSEALFEVGKNDYDAVLDALQNLTGKTWQDLPGAQKKLLAEIQSAKNQSVPLQVNHTVVLNKGEM